jgi:hypothetical protein
MLRLKIKTMQTRFGEWCEHFFLPIKLSLAAPIEFEITILLSVTDRKLSSNSDWWVNSRELVELPLEWPLVYPFPLLELDVCSLIWVLSEIYDQSGSCKDHSRPNHRILTKNWSTVDWTWVYWLYDWTNSCSWCKISLTSLRGGLLDVSSWFSSTAFGKNKKLKTQLITNRGTTSLAEGV